MVQTVAGPVPMRSLGHTQCHEHIYLRKGPSFDIDPALCIDSFELSARELMDYARSGGGTIVDAQPGYFGRDADMLLGLSRESGVNIVAVTGFHKLCFLERDAPLSRMSDWELRRFFASEIADGMVLPGGSRSEAKAGIVKVACDRGALENPEYIRLFRAAARAAADAGAPMMAHTEKDSDVLQLLSMMEADGVPPDRVIICHLDRTRPQAEYHARVLETGCALCYDSVHRHKYVSDGQELKLITDMLEAGFEDQLVLSLDTTRARLRAYGAFDMGLDYILTDFIPMLAEAGVGERQLRKMCRDNAARALSLYVV